MYRVCQRKTGCFESTRAIEPATKPSAIQSKVRMSAAPGKDNHHHHPCHRAPSAVCAVGAGSCTSIMAEEGSQIPACQRCRMRKIRCDHAAPKCSGCAKASSACIIIDPFTQKQYTRDYIHELERKEKELLGKARSERSATNATPNEQTDTSPRDAPSAESTTMFGGYVGESSGMK